MNEIAKTLTFVAVAVVVALVAVLTRPSMPVSEPEDMVGQELFPDFTDPLAAVSLEILEYDEDTASVRPFKVAQVNQRWSIPSHDDYPADAEDQLADAAAGMMGLEVLDMVSDNPGDHELYGVVDPDPNTLDAGATGVGTRVTMKDKGDKTLLSLVVGKEVPDADGLRYVRRTGEPPVYAVAVKTDKLSTQFEDWIEEDLLKLNSWDVKGVEIRDYSIDEIRGSVNMRDRLTFDYNDTGDPKWNLAKDLIFDGNDWVDNPKPMTEDQELDTDKLDEMRRALDDLEIVDVARKPEGMSQNLRTLENAEDLLKDRATLASLQRYGFYPAPWKDRFELFSNEGEIRSTTDEGVMYILRFGNIAGSGDDNKKDDEKAGDEEGEGEEEESEGSGVNRFLFVMAEFDDSALEKPELDPLPEKPEEKPAEEGEADAETEGEEAAADDDEATADEDADAADAEEAGDADEAEESADGDEAAAEEKSEEQKQYEAEFARVESENKRKQEDHDKKVAEGKEKVAELNDRFADWYYVISDEVYRKIHLNREGLIKEKEKEEAGKGEDESEGAEGMPPADDVSPAALDALKEDAPGDDE